MLNPFSAGYDLTAAELNAAFDIQRMKYQETTQTVISSTVFVSSSHLVLPVEASVNYIVEMEIFCTSGATPDFKVNLLLPSGATVRLSADGNTTTTSTTMAFPSDGSTKGVKISGLIDMSTAAGNLTIQFAQNTSSASNTVLEIGSWIRLTKVTI